MKPLAFKQSSCVFPVWGTVDCGFPSPAQDYEDNSLDFNQLLIRNPAATFMFRVQGSALHREGIRHGSILVVDRSVTPRTGKLVVADFNGERDVMKMPAYLDGGDSLQVWGVVTGIVTTIKH